MKILFFYQYFTTPKGSWSTRAYEFARRWVAAGDSVTVVTSVYDKSDLDPSGLVERLEVEGIDVRVINVRLSNKHGKIIRSLTFFWFALVSSWYALTQKTDVVLASSGPITVGLPALVARYVRRRPLVFEVRDLWPEGAIQLGFLRSRVTTWLARRLEAACYRAAHTVVAISEGMRADILRRFPSVQVEVVTNSSDNDLFGDATPEAEIPENLAGKTLVLYTGTLGLIDDCSQLLNAARYLKRWGREEFAFVLIGDGKERRDLEERARMEGLGNVHFLGLQPKVEVARWVRCASSMVIPTLEIGFLDTCSPNKLFDAFAAGVPVIQNTQGWIKDLLERERCGLTVAPGDAEAWANAILKLAEDEKLREQMGRNAKRVALELFDRDKLAEKMRTILQEAAGS